MTASTATLEWRYQPADLLAEGQTIEAHGAVMVIQDGVVRAELDAGIYQADSTTSEKLLRTIKARLAPYEYASVDPLLIDPSPTLTITHQDGRPREIHLQSDFASVRIRDSLEIQIYRNGVLIQDSAQERQDRLHSEAELLSKYGDDELLSRLLASNSASKRDPKSEFTHLYEILEALQTRFGKPPMLTNELGIEKSKVGKFHAVCNDPSTVSRHRGLTKGPLREPTPEEYSYARSFAWEMILSYAHRLDKHSATH